MTHVPYGDLERGAARDGPRRARRSSPSRCRAKAACPGTARVSRGAARSSPTKRARFLFLDEVQTGIGRTGTFLACEHDGVMADAIALAKGLGGGFPVGAMLCREELRGRASARLARVRRLAAIALASAAALTVLAVLDEEHLIEGARTKGEHLAPRPVGHVRRATRISWARARRRAFCARSRSTGHRVRARSSRELRDRGLLTIAGDIGPSL